MAITFTPGQEISRGQLDIFLVDSHSNPTDAAEIYYALYFVDPGPPEVEILVGPAQRTPVHPQIGEYYAALQVPTSASLGTYRIRWFFREHVSEPLTEVVQEFTVTAPENVSVVSYTDAQWAMIRSLRILLRDQNADKFYHFRPPEYEGAIGKYNRVFGQIWEDAELLEYLERALDWFNMFPPSTQGLNTLDQLVNQMPSWRTAIEFGAIVHACMALALNWVADEFSYSIGGVSLDIEKSSKYESIKQNAESQFDKATEAKARTVKFLRGLQQPKYGRGIRSAWGPALARGILSPRSFL